MSPYLTEGSFSNGREDAAVADWMGRRVNVMHRSMRVCSTGCFRPGIALRTSDGLNRTADQLMKEEK